MNIPDNLIWFVTGILDGLLLAYWIPRLLDYASKRKKSRKKNNSMRLP